ncbi:WbuC family cupin fold metalloprotein [Rhodohalobacter sulfatireducens]|uniref:WbuC family cupin fold metalloprotein n=1 Tax=Rhodohalobacter sulfatireducens TaxID=2911366 RepID=A0ABS9KGJ3_9BACT|nr:WbuC family cupin fold metalloprotein [Rhodohalobacter sulfatireducens]MCG2589966.1 WbuC family cupin fold metalloprotein [Rhodohalobacter sulfatireducens]
MSKLAFDNVSGDLFQLSEEMIESGLRESRKSDRKRIILPIHREQDAKVQRMINFLQPGTYIRPHKHPLDHASESLVIIQGSIRFYTFDEDGSLMTIHKVNSKPLPGVVDIEPRVWHSFIVLEDDTILFECKKGPYDAETDKYFADWSPKEGSEKVKEWMENFN